MIYAKEKGYALIYWATCPDRNIPLPLLESFSGSLVDQKVTYQRDLTLECSSAWTIDQNSELKVVEYPQAPATQELFALALLTGGYSRFHLDPNIPAEKFTSLYQTWINRSTLHEIADVVFVVLNPSDKSEFLGMVTGSITNARGKVGLVSVQKDAQGQGIGSLLIKSLHEWMLSKGIDASEVVAQRANLQACKFYERSGYLMASLQHYYHFWVQL